MQFGFSIFWHTNLLLLDSAHSFLIHIQNFTFFAIYIKIFTKPNFWCTILASRIGKFVTTLFSMTLLECTPQKNRFMLDEMFQQITSKSAILHIIQKPMQFFLSFFISYFFIFPTNECPGLYRHRPGHSLGEIIKLHKRKKTYMGFLLKKMANFEPFL